MRNWWYAKCRATDMEILWPTCLREGGTLERAKTAFMIHCMLDPAWQVLGEAKIIEFVDNLEAYD